MKKLIVSLLFICLLCCSGCTNNATLESKAELGQIEYIDFTNYVVADRDTHILYIRYSIGYSGYFSPYYSENGKLCKYEDGKIIEVNADEDDN